MIDEKINSRVLKALYKTMKQVNRPKHWKKQFQSPNFWSDLAPIQKQGIQSYIETEIIEKLIDEIPDDVHGWRVDDMSNLKQQLRDKWL